MHKYETFIEWGEKHNALRKCINTDITINGNYLEIRSEENERATPYDKIYNHIRARYSKPFNPFFLGEKVINIEDISSINIKNERIFGFFNIFLYIIYTIETSSIILYTYRKFVENELNIIFYNLHFIILISYIAFIFFDVIDCYKYKALQIKIKNEKNICIPIENWKKDKKILQNFIDSLKNEKPRIKVRESINKNKKIKILIYIISLILSFTNEDINNMFLSLGVIFVISIPLFLINIDIEESERKIEANFSKIVTIFFTIVIIVQCLPFLPYIPKLTERINYEIKNKIEQKNKSLIIDKKCYTEVNVVRAILKESIKVGNSHFKNKYIITDSGDEIEFEETYFNRVLNNEYNIWIFKYYLKKNNKLLTIKYDSFNDEYKKSSIYMYDTKYIYDKDNNKIISFYIPKTTNKGYSPMTFKFYYKIEETKLKDKTGLELDKIYNVIYSNQLDFLQQNYDFKIIDIFNSHYGKCYIIKHDNDSEKIDYYTYIENNNITSEDDYDGIFLIYKNSPLTNDKNAISYFKEVISLE